jgi:hypothetical protein
MFHRCCPDDTDVPSVLPGAAWTGCPAPLRSHTSTAASMTSRRTGRIVAELAGFPLPGGCVPQTPNGRAAAGRPAREADRTRMRSRTMARIRIT